MVALFCYQFTWEEYIILKVKYKCQDFKGEQWCERGISVIAKIRIYCIIKYSVIRCRMVAQLDYFDKFYRSRLKIF